MSFERAALDRLYTYRYIPPMDTREALLDGALEEFVARGYEGTGVQLLCERGDVTKPTLYYYFSNKVGVLEALLERELADVLSRFLEDSSDTADVTSSLFALSKHFLGSLGRRSLAGQLFLQLSCQPIHSEAFAAFSPYRDKMHAALVSFFKAAEAQHGNFRGRSQEYAILFGGFLNSLLRMVIERGTQNSDEELRTLLHRFEHGIYS